MICWFLFDIKVDQRLLHLGSQTDNETYVEDKLKEVLDEKTQERREYRSIIENFRYTNTELYQKMAQAGETRNNGLFNKKAKWKLATVLPQVPQESSNSEKTSTAFPKSPKPKHKKKEIKASSKVKEPKADDKKVEDLLDENDEVIQSLKWAHDMLLKEYMNRRQTRTQRGSIKRKATGRTQSRWVTHHNNDAKKKARTQNTINLSIYENMKSEEESKKEEMGALVDDIPKLASHVSQIFDNNSDDDDDGKCKMKCEIIDLRRKLSIRRKEGKKGSNREWEVKTEEQKLNEAKEHLKWLQEKQRKNITVDFFGIPRKDINSKIALDSTEASSPDDRMNSNQDNSSDTEEVRWMNGSMEQWINRSRKPMDQSGKSTFVN